jgi:hypothetical protein
MNGSPYSIAIESTAKADLPMAVILEVAALADIPTES